MNKHTVRSTSQSASTVMFAREMSVTEVRNRVFKTWIFRTVVHISRRFIHMWKPSPLNWVAIITNSKNQFATVNDSSNQRLLCGQVDPERAIEQQCYEGLALQKQSFSQTYPLRLIEIDGRGGDGFTFYFVGQVTSDNDEVQRFESGVVYLPLCRLESFVSAEIYRKIAC